MTWSFFWDSSIPAQPSGDAPDWYVAILEREFKRCPPSLPADPRHAALRIAGDRSTKRPRLAATVSEVTRRALAVLDPDLLFELLILDVVGEPTVKSDASPSPHAPRTQPQSFDRKKWLGVAKRMRALAAELHIDGIRCEHVRVVSASGPTHSDALTFGYVGERERCEAHACWLLEQWATEAEARADRTTATTDEPPAPSPLHDVACYRARVRVLAEVLRASGDTWEHGDLADLIVSSASDWTHPPSSIGTRYRYDWTADARGEDKMRSLLVTWIRKQLAVPSGGRARRASQSR